MIVTLWTRRLKQTFCLEDKLTQFWRNFNKSCIHSQNFISTLVCCSTLLNQITLTPSKGYHICLLLYNTCSKYSKNFGLINGLLRNFFLIFPHVVSLMEMRHVIVIFVLYHHTNGLVKSGHPLKSYFII